MFMRMTDMAHIKDKGQLFGVNSLLLTTLIWVLEVKFSFPSFAVGTFTC